MESIRYDNAVMPDHVAAARIRNILTVNLSLTITSQNPPHRNAAKYSVSIALSSRLPLFRLHPITSIPAAQPPCSRTSAGRKNPRLQKRSQINDPAGKHRTCSSSQKSSFSASSTSKIFFFSAISPSKSKTTLKYFSFFET